MKLFFKGQAPTKAHSTDVGFDLHPVSLTIIFAGNNKIKIDNIQDKPVSELELEICEAIEQNRSRYIWNSAMQGIRKLIFDTGTAIKPPAGTWTMLCANSRLCKTDGLIMQNGIGIVDPGYRGTIKATYISTEHSYSVDDILMLCRTCGQLIPMTAITPEAIECEKLDDTDRGDKGFGSSDNK